MSTAPNYTMTNESISIVWEGKMHTVRKGTTNFVALRNAIVNEDWASIPNNLSVAKSLQEWAKDKFTLVGNEFSYNGVALPRDLNQRISSMAASGESPESLFKFWEKLQKNPSYRSVNQLWPFLSQRGIPLTKDGNFLAYKSVRQDFKDHHSGEFDNSPGRTNEMPRNQISDDPKVECHEGFHVGALEYAKTFGQNGRLVICEVNPEDVVCVPYDHSSQKMRVCKYKVTGLHNGEYMSSTVHQEEPDSESVDVDIETDDTGGEEDPSDAGYNPDDDQLREDGATETEKAVDGGDPTPSVKKSKPSKKPVGGKGQGPLPRKPNAKLDEMGLKELMDESLDTLRKYAGKNLQMVGASKIPGGKATLVAQIMKARR